jgi:hypothetical protein
MPSGSARAGKAASKQARKIAASKQLMTKEGRDVLSWLRDNYVIVVGVIGLVIGLAILQFVQLLTGVSVFGGGIRQFDLGGDAAIRSALGDGDPWIIFCQHSATSNLATPAYRKAQGVFTEAATALMATSPVRAAEMDCSRRLEKSGKSVFAILDLPRNGASPATVVVAANGRKPTVVRAPFLTSKAKLIKFVTKRTALSSIDIQPGKAGKRAMRKCLAARKCVILAHSGQAGRMPVKAILTDMMAAHRTAQFATLDTSKAWVSGLPEEVVRVLPRPPNQPQSVTRRVAGRGGRVRNVTVTGWGADNAAADGGGQVSVVLQRDPRKHGSWGNSAQGDDTSLSKRGVIVTWSAADDASGSGWGRLLLSRGNINTAVREADAASQRARAEGGTSGGKTVADVLTAVATPQLDVPNTGAAVSGEIGAMRPPKRITVTKTGGDGRGSSGQSQEQRRHEALAKSAKRRAARERARAEGREADEDGRDAEADVRRQRAREAMEHEAQQWVPEAAPATPDHGTGEYDEEEGDGDELYDEEEDGFEVVEDE